MLAIHDYSFTLYGPAPGLVLPPVDRLTLDTALRDYLAALLARPAAAESSPTELASWVLNIARCLYGAGDRTGRAARQRGALGSSHVAHRLRCAAAKVSSASNHAHGS
jgi:hypothetical protein